MDDTQLAARFRKVDAVGIISTYYGKYLAGKRKLKPHFMLLRVTTRALNAARFWSNTVILIRVLFHY